MADETTENTEVPVQEGAPVEAENILESKESVPVESKEPSTFLNSLNEDLRDQGNLKDFTDVSELAKSYIEVQRLVGNSVRIPSEDASDEAKKAFLDKIKDVDGVLLQNDEHLLNKLGKPETPENYKFEETEVLSSIPNLPEELDGFKKLAFDIGLTNEQASVLVQRRAETLQQRQEDLVKYQEASKQELKKMWGEEYENKLNSARTVAKLYTEKHGDKNVESLLRGPAANNPVFLDMLSELANMYKEKGHVGMNTVSFGVTPEMAHQKIAEKRADPGFMKAYGDALSPGHKKAVDDLAALYEVAYQG